MHFSRTMVWSVLMGMFLPPALAATQQGDLTGARNRGDRGPQNWSDEGATWSGRQWENPRERIPARPGARDRSRFSEMPGRAAGFAYNPDLKRATKLIGMDVVDFENKHVGTVDDLAIDRDRGIIACAIVARGGILGMGEKRLAVPFQALRSSGDRLILQTTVSLLNHVEPIKNDDLAEMNNRRFVEDLYSQFNLQPYWISAYRGEPGAPGQQARQRPPGRPLEYEESWWDEEEYNEEPALRERSGRRLASQEPGQIIPASGILDDEIEGARGEPIGDLENLMVDMKSGAIGYGIVSGQAVFSDALYAVPWSLFEIGGRQNNLTLALDMTERELQDGPAFDEDRWPDMSSPQWGRFVYNYYGVAPVWTYYGFVGGAEEQTSFNPRTVGTFQGTIERMTRRSHLGRFDNIVRLELSTTPQAPETPPARQHKMGQRISVYLAPASFIRKHGISLKPGDRVKVEGSRVSVDGQEAIVATRISQKGKELRIRSDQGRPLWTKAQQERSKLRPGPS